MKRNWDLIRKIALHIEENGTCDQKEELGFPENEIAYHIEIMREAGLVHAQIDLQKGWIANFLTFEGSDFCDAARDECLWEEAWARCRACGIQSVSFNVLKQFMDILAKKKANCY